MQTSAAMNDAPERGFQFLSLVMAAIIGFLFPEISKYIVKHVANASWSDLWRSLILIVGLLIYIESYLVFEIYHRVLNLEYKAFFYLDLLAGALFIGFVQNCVDPTSSVQRVVLLGGLSNAVTAVRQVISYSSADTNNQIPSNSNDEDAESVLIESKSHNTAEKHLQHSDNTAQIKENDPTRDLLVFAYWTQFFAVLICMAMFFELFSANILMIIGTVIYGTYAVWVHYFEHLPKIMVNFAFELVKLAGRKEKQSVRNN